MLSLMRIPSTRCLTHLTWNPGPRGEPRDHTVWNVGRSNCTWSQPHSSFALGGTTKEDHTHLPNAPLTIFPLTKGPSPMCGPSVNVRSPVRTSNAFETLAAPGSREADLYTKIVIFIAAVPFWFCARELSTPTKHSVHPAVDPNLAEHVPVCTAAYRTYRTSRAEPGEGTCSI